MKNISIAGGLLVLAATGAGAWSLDNRRSRMSEWLLHGCRPDNLIARP